MEDKVGFIMEVPEVQSGYNAHSRYALFLIEQLIVILVFALCAAICVRIFTDSFIMASSSNDMNCALTASESAAECFKAVGSNGDRLAELLRGVNDSGTVRVFYGSDWSIGSRTGAVYEMTMTFRDGPNDLILCDISVDKLEGGNVLEFTSAARQNNR